MADLLTDLAEAATIDFETDPIRPRPVYPPEPVGVSIKIAGAPSVYLAWGHPSGNSCSREAGRAALAQVWTSGRPLLFHTSKFDLAVGVERLGLPMPAWDKVHDTLPMLFLLDPRAPNFQLKSSSERLLGWAPEERDAVIDWLVANQPVPGETLSPKPKSEHYAGAYIGLAPPALVSPYACGDTDRTWALALWAAEKVLAQGMLEPYERERRLQPTIMEMERTGIRVPVDRLTRDLEQAQDTFARLDAWLYGRLGQMINLDSGDELARTLIACGAATSESLGLTKTGKVQTNKDALGRGVTDKQLHAALRYRAQLKTITGTFMEPWLVTALANHGLIFTTWHSTRTSHHEEDVGTRTGRLSSTPNFQNIPKVPEPLFRHEDPTVLELPDAPIELPTLPHGRSYVTPFATDEVLIDRDYSQQELRLLAHYEDGTLQEAYRENPWLDVHDHARTLINKMLNKNFARKPIKNTGFGLIYGMGIGKLAARSGTTTDLARQVKNAYLATFPGLRDLYDDMKQRARDGRPLRTWGGRLYYCEAPALVDGKMRQFDYKMLNLLIQGSAADCTKEAVIRYAAAKPAHHRIVLTAHDEILSSVPWVECAAGMEIMRAALESIECDVPMLSEGSWSPTHWAALADYDAKGQLVPIKEPPPDIQVTGTIYSPPGGGRNNDPQGRVMD